MIRRRSDSRTATDGAYHVSDEENDNEPPVMEEDDDDHTPLVMETTLPLPHRSRMFSLSRKSSVTDVNSQRTPTRSLSRRTSAADSIQKATIIPPPTKFTKINKKKRKDLRFSLDEVAGKMYWSSSSASTKKQIYIDDIREVRSGAEAASYMEANNESDLKAGCWLTILYIDPDNFKGRSMKLMHLVAENESTRNAWVKALKHVMKTRDDRMVGMAVNSEKHWLAQWKEEMLRRFGRNEHPESDEKIDLATVRRICRSVSIFKSDRDLQLLFTKVGGAKTGTINQLQYVEFFRFLTERQDIRRIFDRICLPSQTTLSLNVFLHFLETSQGVVLDDSTQTHWLDVFVKYASRGRNIPEGTATSDISMNSEGFRSFLLSSANAALASKPTDTSLNRPLHDYFISSSHNTYLQGRQYFGESSAEMYSEALKRGCRCLEIDCADGPDGKPIVTHVNTNTSKVLFIDCIKVINQYAFWASDYPLIISLEVHCKPEQQRMMAKIMKDILGDKLLLEPVQPRSYSLPSPEELKGKILVKVKIPKPDEQLAVSPVAKRQTHTRHRSVSAPNPSGQQLIGIQPLSKTPTVPIVAVTPQVNSIVLANSLFPDTTTTLKIKTSFSSDDSDVAASPQKSKHVSNITPALGELGVYTRGVKFSSWTSPESLMPNHVYSFNESTFAARSRTKDAKAELEDHNLQYLMRVYPKWQRYDSRNFNPLHFWRRGVQMVATNWQSYDLGTQLNDAMFAAGTDRTGFVLKPPELLRSRKGSLPEERIKLERKQVRVAINIISAQYLEASETRQADADMNPYVVLEMFYPEDKDKFPASAKDGADTSPSSANPRSTAKAVTKRTETVQSNGFDPVFDADESSPFVMTAITKHPDLIFVRFSVFNCPESRNTSRSDPICTFTAKLAALQQGYRHLPLYSRKGELLHSKLFVKIDRDEPEGLGTVAGQAEYGASAGPRGSEESARRKRWWNWE